MAPKVKNRAHATRTVVSDNPTAYNHRPPAYVIIGRSRELPSGKVIIVTANYPESKAVSIHLLGKESPLCTVDALHPKAPAIKQSTSQQIITTNATDINALFKTPFELKQAADVPKFGTVNIAFDRQFLILSNTGIDDKNIVWTFNSLQTGDTQVIVTVHGGIADFVMVKTYDVCIFALDAAVSVQRGGATSGSS